MRPKWLVGIEAQVRRIYEAVNLRDDLWVTDPEPGKSQAIIVMPDRIFFTIVKVPESNSQHY